MEIPVNEPLISKEAKKNVIKAINSNWLSSSGPFVAQFEKEFARYLGVRHGIAVSSGTAALHVALLSLGIKKGDEVLVPAFTMAATWLAVLYVGAKPVFVDCDLETYNIDVKKIEQKITKKTKAIMPAHIYGQACEMDALRAIAKKHGLWVIEDAAEAHGGQYKGLKCGTISDVSCFSFYANKLIACGEGGMIMTDNDQLAAEARKFRDLYHSDQKRFIHEKIGYNYRMANLQAAIGCGELRNIARYLKIKQKMAELYQKNLADISGIKLPVVKPHIKSTYWMFGIVIDEKELGLNRDEFRLALKKHGIDTRDFFYAPGQQPILRKKIGRSEKFPNAEYLAKNGLYLPSGLAISEKQIKYICDKIKEIKKSSRLLAKERI